MTTGNVIIEARTYNTVSQGEKKCLCHSLHSLISLAYAFSFFFLFFFKEKVRGDIRETISDLMNRLGLDILN